MQLQNQYDTWRQSRWHVPDDVERTITCRECHMRLVDSSDPASGDLEDYNRAGDDGKQHAQPGKRHGWAPERKNFKVSPHSVLQRR